MKYFEKPALFIYRIMCRYGLSGIFVDGDRLRRLNMKDNPKDLERDRAVRDISYVLMVLSVTVFLLLVYLLKSGTGSGEGELLRGEPGEGTTIYDMELSAQEAEPRSVKVEVSERQVEDARLPQLFAQAETILRQEMCGENISLDSVRDDLVFVSELPMGISVSWERDEKRIFSESGRLRISPPSEPLNVTVYATLKYHGYERRIPIDITIIGESEAPSSTWETALGRALEEADASSPKEKIYELPQKADDVELNWSRQDDNSALVLLLLGVLFAVMIIPAGKSSVKDRIKKRDQQMKRDYPDIISKFILLMSAGETCRGAWCKICHDYVNARDEKAPRYAYEEMLFSYRELELGAAEAVVYEKFGNRTGLACYSRFATMLSRNLRRGSRDILTALELEAKDAFSERFDEVRRRGEETSTKLLLPMMGMLMIVVAIIMVPAFSGM